jgi:hypothetical protein
MVNGNVTIGLPDTANSAGTLRGWVASLATSGKHTPGYIYDGRVYREDTNESILPSDGALIVCGDPDVAVELASSGYLVTPPLDGRCVFCGAAVYWHYSYRPAACGSCKQNLQAL